MRNLLSLRILLLAGAMGVVSLAPSPAKAQIAVGVSIRVAPPAIPVYEQPPCPVEGYMWTPGYWAYGPAGYYWVQGVWIAPPRVGLLWTPGYWGWGGGVYALACRLLGTSRRLLRRRELWIRIRRCWIRAAASGAAGASLTTAPFERDDIDVVHNVY